MILNIPEDFDPFLKEIKTITKVVAELKAGKEFQFMIDFVKSQKEVDAFVLKMTEIFAGDWLLWVAYPKGISKKYKSEINRDKGLYELVILGFDTVRFVAINDNWSCLRFRKVEFIIFK